MLRFGGSMKARDYWKLSILIGVLLSPIILYMWVFGVVVSSDHSRWAEFGSAMGGIYSPMIAVLAFLVLLRQVNLQQELAKHEFDQGYLQQARQDIEFYGTQLAAALNADVLPGKSMLAVLQEKFRFVSASDLEREDLRVLAESVHQVSPSAFDLWMAINPILKGLTTSQNQMYVLTFESSKQKLIALLSFQICVALDNYRQAAVPRDVQLDCFFSDC